MTLKLKYASNVISNENENYINFFSVFYFVTKYYKINFVAKKDYYKCGICVGTA